MTEPGKNFSMNNTGKRKESDFYETPYSMIRLLLKKEHLPGSVLEPACGGGAILKVLNEFDYRDVTGYDIEQDPLVDFLKEKRKFDTIITNPPYSLSMDFMLRAKQVARKKIIFLLPVSYLHGQERYEKIYNDKKFPLKCIYVFSRYPMLGDNLREDGKVNTGMQAYAWYVWENGLFFKEPVIRFLNMNPFVLKKGE
jgi:hypothetical protein